MGRIILDVRGIIGQALSTGTLPVPVLVPVPVPVPVLVPVIPILLILPVLPVLQVSSTPRSIDFAVNT